MRAQVLALAVLLSACAPQTTSVGIIDAGTDAGRLKSPKPNLMLLVDRSGSMNFAADDNAPTCTARCNQTGQPACALSCPTRLQALKLAVASTLSSFATVGWFGLASFPTGVEHNGVVDACGATENADVRVDISPLATDLEVDLTSAANAVNDSIQKMIVSGGTPTAQSLKFVGALPSLNTVGRDDFVLLITDGLPNCNALNPNNCNDSIACKCTLIPAISCTPSTFCTEGCLDQDASVAAVNELRAKNIKTIVVGFGSEVATGNGPPVLNAMALAGGFAPACPNGTDAECGSNGPCDLVTRLCERKYFAATNQSELEGAFARIFVAE